MSTAPICPIHQKPLRESKVGSGFYCAVKNADGSWCKHKAPGEGGAAPATSTPGRQDGSLPAAALAFAGHLYHGAGGELADDAIAVAIRALTAMRAVL